jgi:hypothetical protein
MAANFLESVDGRVSSSTVEMAVMKIYALFVYVVLFFFVHRANLLP